MSDHDLSAQPNAASIAAHAAPAQSATAHAPPARSMHEGIAVWGGCGSCGAEPYWVEIAAEMGIALGSDYEDGCDGAGVRGEACEESDPSAHRD